ncbi:response regulator transcription factor [Actinomadura pelletieri]|nr:response regulator transcription factor [Actinomadura pelletieri]
MDSSADARFAYLDNIKNVSTEQRLLLCCEKPIYAASFSALLGGTAGIKVIGHTIGERVLQDAAELGPDITLVVFPALTIISHQRELMELAKLSKVMLLAEPENAHRSMEAIALGVRAVLSLDVSADQLIHALRLVAGGTVLIPEAARPTILSCYSSATAEEEPPLAANLTAREKEVILLLRRGASNVEIAQQLSISITTVRTHVHNVLKKLGVRTRGQAVAVTYESGFTAQLRSATTE